MELMSKSAQAILEEELVSYKKRLVNRATQYAEHDGDTLIRDRQILAAIRDYGTPDSAYVQLNQKRKKTKILLITTWLLVLMLLIWLIVSVIYLSKDTQENIVFVVGLSASIASLLSVLLLYTEMKKGKKGVGTKTVVSFLNKWNEFEPLLRYTYKGTNKKGNVSLADLLDYYMNNYSKDKETDERIILSNLKMRNNIVHRGIFRANEDMLERNMAEMDELIKKMK